MKYLKTIRNRNRKCGICGRPVFADGSRYCLRCSKFASRLKRLPHKVARAIWDYVKKYGYVCYYTGMALNMEDPHSPWYCVFDHWAPHDQRKIVLTSALLNAMKSDLSEDEFWYYVRQLANFKRRHTKVRKIKLVYWDRDYTVDDGVALNCRANRHIRNGKCYVCGKKLSNSLLKYCPICAEMVHRLQRELPRLSSETVEEIWSYIRKCGYVCYYTGMSLDVTNPRSPWYCVFDRCISYDHTGKVVITSALLAAMKAGLSEKDFWYYILQLADYKEKGKKIRKKRPVFWNRLFPVDDVPASNIHSGKFKTSKRLLR